MLLMMRADISPGAPRDNGQRAGPRPGDHRDVSKDQGPSCDVSRERVLSATIIWPESTFACLNWDNDIQNYHSSIL